MSRAMGELERQAHRYAEVGWPVFPVAPGAKLPAIPTAHPMGDPARGCKGECGRDGHGLYDATTDHRTIERWWKASAARNVGMATGGKAPDVLDIDQHGEAGNGFAGLAKLRQAGMMDGHGPVIETPSGGLHFYFAGSDQGNGASEKAHIDYRAKGGYVLMPPSKASAGLYTVVSRKPITASFDWGAAKALLEPERQNRRQWTAPEGSKGQGSLDHLVKVVAECKSGVNNLLYWASCRAIEAGQDHMLPDLINAAYAAGEDRRGQPERTVESARQAAGHSEPRPFTNREAAS
jgi:Bifunctional DNA primase/polymerase, N-terminal